jgi:hypothetical protein
METRSGGNESLVHWWEQIKEGKQANKDVQHMWSEEYKETQGEESYSQGMKL